MNFRAMLAVVRKIVVVLVALVVGLDVIRWTGEVFREYTGLFLLLLVTMVLATGALASSVGKLLCRSKVKVIWLALIFYLSLMSFCGWDFARDRFGYRFVPGYYSYYDCEDATPEEPCLFSTYRVNSSLGWGHFSATIEGLSLLYILACFACPWTAYRLWRNAQTNIETHEKYAQNAIQVAQLRIAAEQGNAKAQYRLGFSYCVGAGVPRDYVQAAAWFRKAAEQGNADAQYDLGDLYRDGHGVPSDYAEAYFWYYLAAVGYQDGSDTKRVSKDRDEAASHLTPADLSRAQERAWKWLEANQAKPQ